MKTKIICIAYLLCFSIGITNAQIKSRKQVTGWTYHDSSSHRFHVYLQDKTKVPKGFAFIEGGSFIHGTNNNITITPSDTSLLLKKTESLSTVMSFFIMKTEVTNKEYRMFTDWVRDSIGLCLLADKFPEHGFRKKDGSLNWKKRKSVKDSILTCLENELCIPPSDRIFGRIELDNSKLVYQPTYKLGNSKFSEIAIYPDTLSWNSIFYSYSGSMTTMYFIHPAFNDYPVVGVSYYQALAYADWKSKMDGTLTYRLPTEVEWEFAAQGKQMNRNNKIERLTTWTYPWNTSLLVDKKGYDIANYGMIKDQNNNVTKFYQERTGVRKKKNDNTPTVYTSKKMTFPANSFGLYDMGGNVAEWVADYASYDKQPFYMECEQLPANVDKIKNEKKDKMANPMLNRFKFRNKNIRRDSTGQLLQKIDTSVVDEEINTRNNVRFNYSRYCKKTFEGDMYDINGELLFPKFEKQAIYEIPISDNDVFGAHADGGIVDISDTVYRVNEYGPTNSQSDYYESLNRIKLHNIEIMLNTPDPRIVKGGSWYNGPVYMMISSRQAVAANKQSACVGFRLAASCNTGIKRYQ